MLTGTKRGFPRASMRAACCVLAGLFALAARPSVAQPLPWEIAWAPSGKLWAVTDRTGGCLHVFHAEGTRLSKVEGLQSPRGVSWSAAGLFVAEYDSGTIARIDPQAGNILTRFPAGAKPAGLAIAGPTLLTTDYGLHQLIGLDAASGRERFRLPVARHPVAVAATPQGTLALTAGLLPPGPAGPEAAAEILLIDPAAGTILKKFPLPDGSSNVRSITISPDGRHAAAVHTRGRTALPTTQIDRGWINTNCASLIDLARREWIATCVLDAPYDGAGDPWGAAFLPDGTLFFTLAGTGELMRFDFPRFLRLLSGKESLPPEKVWPSAYADRGTMAESRTAPQRWAAIARDPALRSEFANNLALLSGIDLTTRSHPGASGLRAAAASPDGSALALAAAFDGTVLLADPATGSVRSHIPLEPGPPAPSTEAQAGERLFFDASLCFQGWMSCATCHHEARSDGLNWDLLNDGLGSPKNTKSMLHVHLSPPMTWTGVREGYEESIAKGFFFLLHQPAKKEISAVAAYLRSLAPDPSPHLVRGAGGKSSPSPAALRGKSIFLEAQCAGCHSGENLTNLRSYDVGTGGTLDTPGLAELWRTGPYLHNGSASTVEDVLEQAARTGKHGGVPSLTPGQRQDLAAYLLSL